jgi:beta-barrel assembly-enhancing protease
MVAFKGRLLSVSLLKAVVRDKKHCTDFSRRPWMKMPKSRFSKSGLRMMPLLAVLFTTCLAQAPRPEPVTDQETELGQEIYKELLAKGEIVDSSPLYESLKPVAEAISRVAQSRYPHPFKFFIVHETQPNAFATPGGNVYVVDSLLYFVKNTEQLAGTLCHEVSHTIHRDSIALMKKEKRIERHEVEAAILLGPTLAHLTKADAPVNNG